jgi:hypothetical protein
MALTFDEICIDAHDAEALGAWWSKVLGWRHYVDKDGDVVLEAPPGAGPKWLFIEVPDDKVVKNRIHLDFRPEDQQAEVGRLIGRASHVDIVRASRPGWCLPTRKATNSASSRPTINGPATTAS